MAVVNWDALAYPRHMHLPGPGEISRIVNDATEAAQADKDGYKVEFHRIGDEPVDVPVKPSPPVVDAKPKK